MTSPAFNNSNNKRPAAVVVEAEMVGAMHTNNKRVMLAAGCGANLTRSYLSAGKLEARASCQDKHCQAIAGCSFHCYSN